MYSTYKTLSSAAIKNVKYILLPCCLLIPLNGTFYYTEVLNFSDGKCFKFFHFV